MDAAEWDARYAQSELVWGAPPNSTVVEHVYGLERRAPVGEDAPELPRALDLACGEGRNALWLATHGWQVHAVDYSQVGIDKGRTVATRLSRSVRTRITWQCADVTDLDAAEITGPFELVLMVFLHLPAERRRALLRRAAGMLAPAGTLLVLGHDSINLTDGYGGPQDPSILFTPDDVVADLGGESEELHIRTAERVLRPTEGRDAIDALVVATRPGPKIAEIEPIGAPD
ncbi:class I SAM-dependent methyltransferase [Nocardia puris]|uniref:Methyltransferase family protein n=1 Tax=Nocardia puris TaxID=208602 RepID=A0A366DMT1_9NOCA|nr:class I SAM-dependent methyltransferase [Nocardia puris]MBF6214900.1 class I SAM-dependent methyltransferase [Nocardia puris]MBF6364744.1 class I SAM-dependent methyltransferase [Nocardia puris]MBF6460112.1 class I SAM-dependent methyltransferase [Nocardia puris]RBO91400.1 methyltransferase family protein [Nocardia puris]